MKEQHLILCGEAADASPRGNPLRLRLEGSEKNVHLSVSQLSEAMTKNVPSILRDLLDFAAYLFAADQAIYRDSLTDARDDWNRRLHFRFPARCPQVWQRHDVTEALSELLNFLSDDDFTFDFVPRRQPEGGQLVFDEFGSTFEVDEVMLFSGGLDSLGGALREVHDGRRVALVCHDAAKKKRPMLSALVKDLSSRSPPHFIRHVPVVASKAAALDKEHTQRTRSFLFASLATTVAWMLKKRRIRFYENGVTSMNLPIAGQTLGGRASRTTHPRAIAGLSKFLSVLLGEPFAVESLFFGRPRPMS